MDEVAAQRVLAGQRLGGIRASADDAVVGIDEHDARSQRARLGVGHGAVADDDDEVALMDESGGGPVDADDAAPAWSGDDVGLQPRAVVDVSTLYLLTAH